MERKYISFTPLFSGLCNVIMSYEIALAISYITGRTLILPPKTWLLFISESQNLEDFSDIWEIFDKDLVKSEFNCIDYEDVPEFEGHFDELKSERSFSKNISKCIGDVEEIVFPNRLGEIKENNSLCDTNIIICDKIINYQDFEIFSENRKPFFLNKEVKFLHFEENLFGSFWYCIYPGDKSKRNELKNKINKCLRYKKKFYEISGRVKKIIGSYNSLHLRRGDFLYARPDLMKEINSSSKVLEKISSLLPTHLPVYISTDEPNISFFDSIKSKYKIYFYEYFGFDLTPLERAVVEQIICYNSDQFYGTWLSTYTKRINVMRGVDNKPAYDWMAFNYNPGDLEIKSSSMPIPWRIMPNKYWEWNSSYHPQWTFE